MKSNGLSMPPCKKGSKEEFVCVVEIGEGFSYGYTPLLYGNSTGTVFLS